MLQRLPGSGAVRSSRTVWRTITAAATRCRSRRARPCRRARSAGVLIMRNSRRVSSRRWARTSARPVAARRHYLCCLHLAERAARRQIAGRDRGRHQLRHRRARVRWDEAASSCPTSWRHCRHRLPGVSLRCGQERGDFRKERRDALWRLWVAGFGMMQVMMYAYPVCHRRRRHDGRISKA